MSYDPNDHVTSAKAVIAGWAVCLCVAGAALSVTAGRPDVVPETVAAPVGLARQSAPCPMAGARLPAFAECRSDKNMQPTQVAARIHQASTRTDHCG
jgi:hypothetical protein